MLESVAGKIPLARPGALDEFAKVVSSLASDESSNVTGTGFFVEGGMTQVRPAWQTTMRRHLRGTWAKLASLLGTLGGANKAWRPPQGKPRGSSEGNGVPSRSGTQERA